MPIRLVIANLAVKWGREFEPIAECLTRAGQPEAHAYHALLNFGCSLIGRHGEWVFLKCGGQPEAHAYHALLNFLKLPHRQAR